MVDFCISPDLSTETEYSIRLTCGTKEELPYLTPKEYDEKTNDPDFVGQVRMPMGPMPKFNVTVLVSIESNYLTHFILLDKYMFCHQKSQFHE